jgi:hypothetical protein
MNDTEIRRLPVVGAIQVADARSILEPLPKLMAPALRSFVGTPPYVEDSVRPQIQHEDIVAICGNDSAARLLALILQCSSGLPITLSTYRADLTWFTLEPHLDILRYQDAKTVEEVLAVQKWWPTTEVGAKVEGIALRFIERVFADAVANRRWPSCLGFTVGNLDLRYVPGLIRDLHPRFLPNDFGYARTVNPIALRLNVLEYLDPQNAVRSLYPKVVLKLAEIWKAKTSDKWFNVTFDALQAEMCLPELELVPVVLFMEREPWVSAGRSGNPERWNIGVDDRISAFRNIRTWDDFLARRKELYRIRPANPLACV